MDEARKRNHQKRGGGLSLALLDEAIMLSHERDDELLALNEALESLERRSERKCRVVELRYFIGLTIEETAEVLGVTADFATADEIRSHTSGNRLGFHPARAIENSHRPRGLGHGVGFFARRQMVCDRRRRWRGNDLGRRATH